MTKFLLAAALSLTAIPALAEDVSCTVPEAEARGIDALKTELTAKGWDVRNVKTEHGCYEVYAMDENGKKVEAFFDPKTFEIVGYDD